MKPLPFAATFLMLLCLLAVANATPGKVYINGKCIDCNKPDDDDSVVVPSSSTTFSLTSGAMAFAIIYQLLGLLGV